MLQPIVKDFDKICPISQIMLLLHVCREEAKWQGGGEECVAVGNDKETWERTWRFYNMNAENISCILKLEL